MAHSMVPKAPRFTTLTMSCDIYFIKGGWIRVGMSTGRWVDATSTQHYLIIQSVWGTKRALCAGNIWERNTRAIGFAMLKHVWMLLVMNSDTASSVLWHIFFKFSPEASVLLNSAWRIPSRYSGRGNRRQLRTGSSVDYRWGGPVRHWLMLRNTFEEWNRCDFTNKLCFTMWKARTSWQSESKHRIRSWHICASCLVSCWNVRCVNEKKVGMFSLYFIFLK